MIKIVKNDKDENKDKNKDKNKESDIISSLDFSELDEDANPKDTYKKKNYKTYQMKKKKNENENSNDKKSKESNNYG